MTNLSDRVVLVTGAKGGLGSAVTRAFLAAGATVAGTSRNIAQSDFASPRFAALLADLGDAPAVERMVAAAMERFARIDALVHVAGGFAGGKPVHETDDVTWDGMMNLNAQAAFYVFRAVIPRMRKGGGGAIVAIGSRAGVQPAPMIGAYSASKAALVSLVQTVALENRDVGIRANVILPATMDTPANGPGDWVSVDRVADLAVFLASDEGREISGAAIPVYGKQL